MDYAFSDLQNMPLPKYGLKLIPFADLFPLHVNISCEFNRQTEGMFQIDQNNAP